MFKPTPPSAAKPMMKEKHIKFPLPGMGKKKGAANPAAVKPAASGAPPAGKPQGLSDAKPAQKSAPPKKGKRGGGGPLKLLLPILLLAAVVAGGYFAYTRFFGGGGAGAGAPPPPTDIAALIPNEQPDSSKSLSVKPTAKKTVNCNGKPKFLAKVGFASDVTSSTNEKGVQGVILFGASAENSDAVTRYQHQSWSRAGFLDAYVMDRNGNLYFAPSPRTGLGIAEPKNQDQIFKLDTRSGELASYVALPSAAPSSPENPFGVLGLAYDCETNSLFATTVTGSSDAQQMGRIFRIDLNTNEIAGQRENVDAYGIAVRATGNGKQVVYGSPHDAQIRALDLDADGNFQGDPRAIAALNDPLRARKISFANENEMVVQAAEFSFANAEIPQETETRFTYDAAGDKWNVAQ